MKQNVNKKDKKDYFNPKGFKNIEYKMDFISICKMTQSELKEFVIKELMANGYNIVIEEDGFVYAKGNVPYLLTAHMDTVHKECVKDYYVDVISNEGKTKHIISSPQGIGGDDRCGVYMILQIIKKHKCSVLFCEEEEIGGIGSRKFCKTPYIKDLAELNYLIELDRANSNDAVFYNCANPDFINFITKTTGYKEAYGSFSDISNLSPACDIASVNLSCGYYKAHTTSEYVVVEEMENTIKIVDKLLSTESKQYEYMEEEYDWGLFNYNYYKNNQYRFNNHDSDEHIMLEVFAIVNGKEEQLFSEGKTETEAWGNFFLENIDISFANVLDYDFYYEY